MSALETAPCTRGTTNRNARGSSYTRKRRREWLVETYRANRDLYLNGTVRLVYPDGSVVLGEGVPACRCYRCGVLLSVDTVTVDRIKPGIEGGTYRRENIRPACAHCNSETGGLLAARRKRGKR